MRDSPKPSRVQWARFFRDGDYAILLLLLMPILGVFGISRAAALVQLLGVFLYLVVVLKWVISPIIMRLCYWTGIALWFGGLVWASFLLLFTVF